MSSYHKNSIPLNSEKKIERAGNLAQVFTEKQIGIVLDNLENALLNEDGVVVYNREIVNKVIGERIALVYVMGILDKSENKSAGKIILA